MGGEVKRVRSVDRRVNYPILRRIELIVGGTSTLIPLPNSIVRRGGRTDKFDIRVVMRISRSSNLITLLS